MLKTNTKRDDGTSSRFNCETNDRGEHPRSGRFAQGNDKPWPFSKTARSR
jgi:hypothetical protein